METVYFTGIDQHKRTSFLTTLDRDGDIVRSRKLKNNPDSIRAYFRTLPGEHHATVETTTGWYWMSDLLFSEGVDLSLAHAKFVKAISYAKVKTDKVDAMTLAQLLRVGLIPEAHKISPDMRDVRDTLRARLHLVEKHTSAINSVHRVFEKFNTDSLGDLPELFRLQADMHTERAALITEQIKTIDSTLNHLLLDSEDIQRLLWIPGIGRLNAFSIYLEVDGIERFPTVKNFYSYCRLVPGAHNSGGKTRHRTSKEGNKYLKIAFSHAATRAIQYFPVVKKYYQRMARKKGAPIARALVAKEIAKSVYFVLLNQEPYNRVFKSMKLEKTKTPAWPRRASPDS